jgi:hypothetical protein
MVQHAPYLDEKYDDAANGGKNYSVFKSRFAIVRPPATAVRGTYQQGDENGNISGELPMWRGRV